MLQEDFDQLISYMKNIDPGQVDMEAMMGKVMGFFTGVKKELMTAAPEEREEIFKKLHGMYADIMNVSKGFASKLGISEQELMKLAEDQRNFTPEQRELMDKTRSRMMSEVGELASYLHAQEKKEGEGEKKVEGPKPSTSASARKTSRSQWMRS